MLKDMLCQLISSIQSGDSKKRDEIYHELDLLGMDKQTARVLMRELYNETKRERRN